MRKLTDHIISSDQATQLAITVLDEPGQGGACHDYRISWGTDTPTSSGPRCSISFQNGPINEYGVNGVTHEALLAILIDRLEHFQAGPFACRENAIVLTHLQDALMWLQSRTRKRMARGVEGTHTV